MNFLKRIKKLAKNSNKTIVFPEASYCDRVIQAVKYIKKHKIANVILIGDESSLVMQDKKLCHFTIINPKTSNVTNELCEKLYEARKEKGMTKQQAQELILDPIYFSTMLVKCGYADGMVGGAETSTAIYLKPALQLLTKPDCFVNTFTIMVGKNNLTDNPFFLADCGLMQNPTAEQLNIIAKRTYEQFCYFLNTKPKLAFLSYSSHDSGKGESVEKMKNAFNLFKSQNPNVLCQGEIQLDSAISEKVAKLKLGDGQEYYGKNNIFIFPELNSANICYKAMSNLGKLYAIGPITVGFTKPVNDLSRSCSVKDIIYETEITVIQCLEMEEK